MVSASVILCTHNRAGSLKRALASLSELEVPAGLEWELFVVDNNPPADPGAVVELAAGQARLPCRYLLEPRPGKSFALNAGVAQAVGKGLVFTDGYVSFER